MSRVNRPKAADAKITLNFDFGPDGKYLVELENGVLNHTANRQATNADATVTLTRDVLNKVMLNETNLDQALNSGEIKIAGNKAKLSELVSYLDNFEFWVNIVTP